MPGISVWKIIDHEADLAAEPATKNVRRFAGDTGREYIHDGAAWRNINITYRGTWSGTYAYQKQDVVTGPDGNAWEAVRPNIGITPVEGADWTLFLPKGQGVPLGGTTGQIAKKNSSADFDVGWSSTPPPHHALHEPGGADPMAVDAAAATGSLRTLGTGAQQGTAGNDSRLSDTRTPTDATVTDAKVAVGAAIAEAKLALASDAAAGTASRRTLGTGAQQSAPGNDARIVGAVQKAGDTMSGLLALSADAANPLNPVSMQQWQTERWKPPARFVVTGTLPTYTATVTILTASANGVFPTTDTVTPALNDVVLVVGETSANAPNNGPYTITQLGSGSAPWILTRSPWADTSAKVASGIVVRVTEGSAVNKGSEWYLSTTGTITLGTTSLTFAQTVQAGTGLTKSAGDTLGANFGTGAGTVTQGNDSRVVNAVQGSRALNTTAPLTGGGDLSADRTLAVSAATESAAGVSQLADEATVDAGTDTAKAVSAAKYKQLLPSKRVRLASTANVNVATGGLVTVDGVTTAAGNVVLLKNQTTASENGSWVAASGAWTRSVLADDGTKLKAGTLFAVEEGTQHGTLWVLDTPNPITVGTTALTFSQIGAGGGGSLTPQDEGVDLVARPRMNFIGPGVTAVDNSGASKTDVTIAATQAAADLYPDFAGPGSVPATSANATTTTPAQILYLAGNRVPFASESHTYGSSATTFIDGTPAGAFVYTTGSLTAGNFRMFSVVTTGSVITAVNDLRGWHPLEGQQTGLILTVGSAVTNANQLTLTGGSCYQPGTRKIITGASVTLPTLTLAASTWYYVYVYDNAGVLTADVSTTAPVSYQGDARQKTGDGTRRYRGAIKTNASGRALCYERAGTVVRYKEDVTVAPLAILVNQVPSNPLSLGGGIPPTSKMAYFMQLAVSGTGYFQTSDDPLTDGTSVGFSLTQGVTWVPTGPLPTNASQQIRVEGSPTMYLAIAGYTEGLG